MARLFPNEALCLRLVSAVLIEIAEDWQTADKRYVTFSEEYVIETTIFSDASILPR